MILNFKTYRSRKKSKWLNDGFRSLYESIIPYEVISAMEDWKNNSTNVGVLIGGLALSYYERPRYTEDIDFIFLTEDDVPDSVYKFKKNRKHSFEHIKTGVEIEVITPGYVNKPKELFDDVYRTAIESDGIKIASPLALIAMKLFRSQSNERDRVDIIELCKYCHRNNINIDLSDFHLSELERDIFDSIFKDIDFENMSENMYMLNMNQYFNSKIKNERFKFGEYDIVVFKEEYGEPRFEFGINLENRIRKYSDFQYSISISKLYENENNLRIVDSSTDYKSFNGFEEHSDILKEWLNENYLKLKDSWNRLNPKRKI